MAIHLETDNADKLLSSFKAAIDDGRIATWSYDEDGDFTHTAEQWINMAWLRPIKRGGNLIFIIVKPKNNNISSIVYAVYHGRFIESMLSHCDTLFNNAVATAMPSDGDLVA